MENCHTHIIGKAQLSFHLAVLESIDISTNNCYCVDKRSPFSHSDSIGNILYRQVALIGQPEQSCARVSDWSVSIYNWVYIFLSVEFSIYVLTLNSEEFQTKSLSSLKCLLFSKPFSNFVTQKDCNHNTLYPINTGTTLPWILHLSYISHSCLYRKIC